MNKIDSKMAIINYDNSITPSVPLCHGACILALRVSYTDLECRCCTTLRERVEDHIVCRRHVSDQC